MNAALPPTDASSELRSNGPERSARRSLTGSRRVRPFAWGGLAVLWLLAAAQPAGAQTAVRFGETDPRDERVRAALRRVYTNVHFDDIALRDVLERLRGMFGVNMYVEWTEADEYGVTPGQKVALRLKRATGRMALRLVLEQAGPEPVLRYHVRDGVLTIGTSDFSQGQMFVRTYSVRDLVAPRRDAMGVQDWDSEEIRAQANRLATVIMDNIQPDEWRQNGGVGSAEWLDGILTVSAFADTHYQLKGLLTALRRAQPGEDAPILPEQSAFDADSEAARRALDEVLPSVRFYKTPLREALEWIEAQYDGSMHVLWPAMKEIDMPPERLVEMRLDNVTIAETLWLLLSESAAAFRVEEGVLLVGVGERVKGHIGVHVYGVQDIIAGDEEKMQDLLNVICDTLEPDSWNVNGGLGSVAPFDDIVVVRNAAAVQVDVRALLASIRQTRAAAQKANTAVRSAP